MKKTENRQTIFYRPSGKFSVFSGMMMAVFTFVTGSGLLILYQYFYNWCPIVWLVAIAAVLAGVILGAVAGGLVRIFKFRNTGAAIVFCTIGFLGAVYVRWSLYDYQDLQRNRYAPLKEVTAYEHYEFEKKFFSDRMNFDEAYDILNSMDREGMIIKKSDGTVEKMTVWKYNGYDKLLGTSKKEARQTLEKAKTMSAFEFMYQYRKVETYRDFWDIIKNPAGLWKDIIKMNKEGRWSFSTIKKVIGDKISGKSGKKDAKENMSVNKSVKGLLLWNFWGTELYALGYWIYKNVKKKTSQPFIEAENRWADFVSTKGTKYLYIANGNEDAMYQILSSNPEYLLSYVHMWLGELPEKIYYVELWISQSVDECYMSMIEVQHGYKERYLFKYMRVSRAFVLKFNQTT